MGKIFCLMGKSSTGKDTIYKLLLTQNAISPQTIVPYTTRPIRAGEAEGIEYHFVSDEAMQEMESKGQIIELRAYDTVHGISKYATVNDGQIDLEKNDYLIIGTLESYIKIRTCYGEDAVIPIYIEVDDGVRLQRALKRERPQEAPGYTEMCRRFIADAEDFAEEKIEAAGITGRFVNETLQKTVEEITDYMLLCNG